MNVVGCIQDKMASIARTGDGYVEMTRHVTLLTLDIILRCAFSYEIDCQTLG